MKGFLNAVFQEVRLDLKESLQYRTSLLSDAAIFVGSFLAAFFLGSGSSLTSFYRADATQGIMLLLIGYLFWGNSSAALGYCTGTLQGEMERGIFEMRLQSRYPLTLLLRHRHRPPSLSVRVRLRWRLGRIPSYQSGLVPFGKRCFRALHETGTKNRSMGYLLRPTENIRSPALPPASA